ncbi:type ISP restriction/modification enzyme [Marinobacter psychrophilus]|uniref:type ISP restriction/modification enzyme n=1 Tax=Marinobacter psychrophilus TaxID=330734 RepID=UPI001D0D1015|nr:type ISP restriction/modification enzyme [Marinobacter psychrophilus]
MTVTLARQCYPQAEEHGKIYFHDIGDYLTREQKLEVVSEFGSIAGITQKSGWQMIEPDEFGDWLNQRDPFFDTYMALGDKKDKAAAEIFDNYSRGVETSRDAWVYNYSESKLKNVVEEMVDFYNSEVKKISGLSVPKEEHADYIDFNTQKISWGRAIKNDLLKLKSHTIDRSGYRTSLYRPFTKSNFYFDNNFNNMVYQMHKFFPQRDSANLVICLTLAGTKGFSVLISDTLPDLHLVGDAQCFPFYLYESNEDQSDDLLSQGGSGHVRKDAITNDALEHFQSAYPSSTITKEDIFYYIYSLLHSEEYRERYADNLIKQLPRILRMKQYGDFVAFAQAGRDLAALHLNYESVDLNTQVTLGGSLGLRVTEQGVKGGQDADFTVTKIKPAKRGEKSKVIYNSKITIENIPEEAYDYVVNGKPALEWVMERQAVTTDKKSGIVNDANDWAVETMDNPRYPLELFLRVITVSLETQKIVRGLPKLDIL